VKGNPSLLVVAALVRPVGLVSICAIVQPAKENGKWVESKVLYSLPVTDTLRYGGITTELGFPIDSGIARFSVDTSPNNQVNLIHVPNGA
jgi:hypothetical protein